VFSLAPARTIASTEAKLNGEINRFSDGPNLVASDCNKKNNSIIF